MTSAPADTLNRPAPQRPYHEAWLAVAGEKPESLAALPAGKGWAPAMELPSRPALVQAPQLSGAACLPCLTCITTAPLVPVA